MTQKIVFALKVTLSPEEQAKFQQAPTQNLETYDAYLHGSEAVYRLTPESQPQAQQLFERTLELERSGFLFFCLWSGKRLFTRAT